MTVQPGKDGSKEIPAFKPGDTLRVHLRVVEGDSERIQVFEGVVLRRRGHGISESFTVRKTSFGVGVERTIPLQSPRIQRIELAKTGRARRARLYYLRNLKGKAARLSEEDRSGSGSGSESGSNNRSGSGADAAAAKPSVAEPQKPPRAEAAPA